ncbi:MAG: cation-transporting P-type ATPase [Candidatus Hodarchaeales archaeon]|jgi:Ca2+-transporting ATPase
MDFKAKDLPWHSMKTEKILKDLETSTTGLYLEEVVSRQLKFGKNTLPESKKKSRTRIFLKQFNDILIFILFGAVVISLILAFVESSKYASLSIEHFVDSIVIIIVLFLNAIIGFYQEIKAEKDLL